MTNHQAREVGSGSFDSPHLFGSVKLSSVFWASFSDELLKIAAEVKSPTASKVPDARTNWKGMERFSGKPGKTPITAPGKENASLATASGVGHSLPVGRTGTSAHPSPQPIPVT